MVPNSAGILVLGDGDTAISGLGTLPIDLSIFGLTGCPGNIEPQETSLVQSDASGVSSRTLNIPNVPAFVGTRTPATVRTIGGTRAASPALFDGGARFVCGNPSARTPLHAATIAPGPA